MLHPVVRSGLWLLRGGGLCAVGPCRRRIGGKGHGGGKHEGKGKLCPEWKVTSGMNSHLSMTMIVIPFAKH
jgi:hypothetical protein